MNNAAMGFTYLATPLVLLKTLLTFTIVTNAYLPFSNLRT